MGISTIDLWLGGDTSRGTARQLGPKLTKAELTSDTPPSLARRIEVARGRAWAYERAGDEMSLLIAKTYHKITKRLKVEVAEGK